MENEDRAARVRAQVEASLARARAARAAGAARAPAGPAGAANGNGHTPHTPAPEPPQPSASPQPVPDESASALGGLARIAASAAWHTSGWAAGNYLRGARRLAEAATSPAQALRLARDIQLGAEGLLLTVINSTETGQRMSTGPAGEAARRMADAMTPQRSSAEHSDDHGHPHAGNGHVPPRTLREEGEQLLRKSRDVRFEVDAHPAYERILSELAPDEGRILRLLLLQGPQAAVDVRTGGPLGLLNSRLIAPGISMIGARAGARYVDRVPSYLNNLFRLGLIWFSRETLRDHMKYQVLEAQPEVLDAIHSVTQAKVVRRSIHLTPFGEDFCRVCLMPESTRLSELPAHSDPPEGKAAVPPVDAREP